MSELQNQRVTVELLGKEQQFACPAGQEDALIASAKYLNDLVDKMKQRSTVRNDQKALLMAALNISHELLEAKTQQSVTQQQQDQLIDKLSAYLGQSSAE
ncbi:MAG: cell division protein ZapA [Pseudoalteromonas rhizosphaerae]|jgi:cell division protein ZapA|uniref:Cell division protein ZapA n=1 Tax=Pseudoalteromonas neustonica TaxID=1840331 RepID=A0ABY3FDD5_9GAMM|nr:MULTISPECIES: cell division protein ZapA [Pseudoalteromonas]MBB1294927.1 cell division protein ZapA [Pseudoalteromonas sp. SR41-4]MBB1302857.1 cell division protein ZapA [Pseudoalteromonas sp. SR44-8]MBB1311037.1 cell division protein ZapA [Pseudoalteromonas sp. SR41-8]MBB1399238.1 cell division protein ZapA [Pseudoalteromonas sp. SG44-8]MBB1410743.1 cell division protein ZapA [Pseudoalteromonas sp. SG44-17]|tara:strand:+ start:2354 stop:2653 length:300 start_codon:yes stop_codon:yes gene_type:complete